MKHSHKCENGTCNRVWVHSPRDFDTQVEYDQAHLCPACGTEQRMIHQHYDHEGRAVDLDAEHCERPAGRDLVKYMEELLLISAFESIFFPKEK
jgi:hypothetical protein